MYAEAAAMSARMWYEASVETETANSAEDDTTRGLLITEEDIGELKGSQEGGITHRLPHLYSR